MKNILSRLFGEKRSSLENPQTPLTGQNLMMMSNGGGARSVTEYSSMNTSAVFACVRVLSNTIASLPLQVFERKQNDAQQNINIVQSDTPEYALLHDTPNLNMSSFRWRKAMVAHIELWGNHYSYLARNALGRIKEIRPLLPTSVQPFWKGAEVWYRYLPTGDEIAPDDMLHFTGETLNGYMGISTVQAARRSIGLGLSADEFSANFYENGAMPSVIFTHPNSLGDAAHTHLKESIIKNQTGAKNAFKPMILEEGMKAEVLSMTMTDAQFIETRKFSITDIARWFGVPPHLIGDLSRSTNNNIEQQSIEYVMHTIRPRVVSIEQEINRKVFKNIGGKTFAEFNLDGLLRGDTATRGEYNNKMVLSGILTRNEVRARENYNPLPGLDEPLTPVNTTLMNDKAAGKTQDPANQDNQTQNDATDIVDANT